MMSQVSFQLDLVEDLERLRVELEQFRSRALDAEERNRTLERELGDVRYELRQALVDRHYPQY